MTTLGSPRAPKTIGRGRRNAVQFIRFSIVGGTGVLVNMAVLILLKKTGAPPDAALWGLATSEYHVRWYHVFSTAAFFVANLWNYQLNRSWTFAEGTHRHWLREYLPFLAVGLLAQLIGLLLLTLLMHPESPIALPRDIFDDSSGLRTRLYWGQLIVIALTTPLSFVLNKIWTFATVRTHRLHESHES